jgi:AraC-like DNA-binding protein
MPRNSSVELFDKVSRPLIAVGNQYADRHVIRPHRHRRSQLLYGTTGTLMVMTAQGSWIVPPQRGVWIPAGVTHEVHMLGPVATHSLYLEPDAARDMPDRCQVIGISPFMRGLLAEAVDLPVEYDPASRAGAVMALIQHELRRQQPLPPLALPFPADGQLAKRCRAFLQNPTPHETIEDWSRSLGMSRRSFTRLFRRETGLSFVTWRQQACLAAALPRLVAGEAVTAVAIDLGYDNPAAFTTMFKRVLGSAPRHYLQAHG